MLPVLKEFSNTKSAVFLLFLLGVFYTYLFYPGWMSPDSESTYSQAVNHYYIDNSPPLMAVVWHYLDLVCKGPFLMLLFNMLLLWGSMYVGLQIFKGTLLAYWYFILPFSPYVISCSGWIWKDVIFTFGYGLIGMYLAFKNIKNQKIPSWALGIIFTGLFYFTSVKYQAKFILPIMLFYIFYTISKKHVLIKTILASAVMIFLINTSTKLIVHEETKKGHFWQYVKIYDLAGISIRTNRVLLPRFLWKREAVTVSDITKRYELYWEPLVVFDDSPFRATENKFERQGLIKAWNKAVLHHPIAYFQHRFYVWFNGLILSTPIKDLINECMPDSSKTKDWLKSFARAFKFVFIFPFLLFFTYIGGRDFYRQKSKYAAPLFFLNLMGCTLLTLLFVFSLAGVGRYIFFTVFLLLLSFPFGYRSFITLPRR
ncbi:MAG: hypothetical protein ACTSXG_01650 [Alphaproteobacteria bacterium]